MLKHGLCSAEGDERLGRVSNWLIGTEAWKFKWGHDLEGNEVLLG